MIKSYNYLYSPQFLNYNISSNLFDKSKDSEKLEIQFINEQEQDTNSFDSDKDCLASSDFNKYFVPAFDFVFNNSIEEDTNNSNSDYAYKLALKFNILYSKLSNNEPEIPFLSEKQKIFEEMNIGIYNMNNMNNSSQNKNKNDLGLELDIHQEQNSCNELDEDLANIKIKMMHLLDQTFYHFNCKDNSSLNINSLSAEVIMAIHSCLYIQNIKKYDNQYYIDSCKKELFSKDDESYYQILRNSKILDYKEFSNFEWKYIDTLLDIIETRKELVNDLHKNKFFRKILFNFMPSKELLTNQPWSVNNFIYI